MVIMLKNLIFFSQIRMFLLFVLFPLVVHAREYIVSNPRNLRGGYQLVEANSGELLPYELVDENVDIFHSGSWALDRMDQPIRLNGEYNPKFTGEGMDVYVVDTGLSNVHGGFSVIEGSNFSTDCNGHGTHIGSLIGSQEYGIAPKVWMYSIRVMDCNGRGNLWGLIQGLNWVMNRVIFTGRRSIINMSFQALKNRVLDDMVRRLVDKGLVVVAAAGNGNIDACGVSPAREPRALTVGGLNEKGTKTNSSNYGSCVDLYAPGERVIGKNVFTGMATTRTGTSTATAIMSGVAALAWQENPSLTVPQLIRLLKNRYSSCTPLVTPIPRTFPLVFMTSYDKWFSNEVRTKDKITINGSFTGVLVTGNCKSNDFVRVEYNGSHTSITYGDEERTHRYRMSWPIPIFRVKFVRRGSNLLVTLNHLITVPVPFVKKGWFYATARDGWFSFF